MKYLLLAAALTFSLGCNSKSNAGERLTLSKDNTLVLNDEVNSMTVAKLLEEARVMDETLEADENILLVLDTPGGSIMAGMELITGLNGLDHKVDTLVVFAASMGFQIAQGLNTRYVVKTGEYMSHKAYADGGFGGEFGGKEPSQLTTRYNSWLEKLKELDLQTVKRTKNKQTLESYQNAYENELWISGQKAVDAGYSDKVVSGKCDSSFKGTNTKEFPFFGMIIYVQFSNCPLITGPLSYSLKIPTNKGTTLDYNKYKTEGGQFGNVCTIAPSLLCPKDITLTEEAILKNKDQVMATIKNKNNKRYSVNYNL